MAGKGVMYAPNSFSYVIYNNGFPKSHNLIE